MYEACSLPAANCSYRPYLSGNEKSACFCAFTPPVPTVPTYLYIYRRTVDSSTPAHRRPKIGAFGRNRERSLSNPQKTAKKTVPSYVGSDGTAGWEQ